MQKSVAADSGLYVAGERAMVVVDVVFKYRMPDGTERELEKREVKKIVLGETSAHALIKLSLSRYVLYYNCVQAKLWTNSRSD